MLRRIALPIGSVLLFWATTMSALGISDAIAAHHPNAMMVTGALAAPATFGLTWLFVKWQRKTLADFGFEFSRGSGLRFCIGVALGAALVGFQTVIMWFAGGVRWIAVTPSPATLAPLLGYLLLATREELAFRGYPLRLLASKTNPWLALLIVSCLFVIEHRLGGASWPSALLGPGLGALVFGMAALTTRGLALPIGLHAAWNIGDWMRGGKGDNGFWRLVVDPTEAAYADRVAWISYVFVMLCALVGLMLWQRAMRPLPVVDHSTQS